MKNIKRYRIWHFGAWFSSADADTATEALNVRLSQGWFVVAAASTYMVLAQYPEPAKPGRKPGQKNKVND